MLKNIKQHRRKDVYYDTEKKEYVCIFKPKLINRLKFFLRLRKYPGENFNFIATELNKIGLKTPEIVKWDKYKVITKEISGDSLFSYTNYEEYRNLWEKYIETISLILNSNFYCGDLNYGNFIVHNNELYLLDLEDYRKDAFIKNDLTEALKRLRGKVHSDWVYDEIIKRVKK